MKSLDYLSGVLDTIAIQSEIDDQDCSWTELTVLPVVNINQIDEELLKHAYLDYYSDCYDLSKKDSLLSEDWRIAEKSLGSLPARSLDQLIDRIISFDHRYAQVLLKNKDQKITHEEDRIDFYRKFLGRAIDLTLGKVTRVSEYTMYPPFEVALSWHYYLIEGQHKTIFIEWTGCH
ncbi:hypothetical protein [Psychrobacter piscatorii]|uniref:hypothetical protein n=1 Tax=Psychrobacter piscatorii TaxID=554343 RepID=UPI0037352DD4